MRQVRRTTVDARQARVHHKRLLGVASLVITVVTLLLGGLIGYHSVQFFNDTLDMGSLSMRSVIFSA